MTSFYEDIEPVTRLDDALDPARYRAAPADWHLAITDIENSTAAIDRGQHKAVNMIAAACIAAVRNSSPGRELPYAFGGDGATLLIPPERAGVALAALSGVRSLAEQGGLTLRTGAVTVGALRARGHEVMVARYEVSPGITFAMFRGGGVHFMDRVIRDLEPSMPAALAMLPHANADPDLAGLSCRWEPIASRGGCTVSLVVVMLGDDDDYRPVLGRLLQIAGEDSRPVTGDALAAALGNSWFPSRENIEMEIDAAETHEKRGRFRRRFVILRNALLLQLGLRLKIGFIRRGADRYLAEVARNSDFCQADGALQMVIDCTPDRLAQIRTFLAQLERAGTLLFGLHVSDSAMMTCLVDSAANGHHVHFIDGAGGGYTRAAKAMKAKLENALIA